MICRVSAYDDPFFVSKWTHDELGRHCHQLPAYRSYHRPSHDELMHVLAIYWLVMSLVGAICACCLLNALPA